MDAERIAELRKWIEGYEGFVDHANYEDLLALLTAEESRLADAAGAEDRRAILLSFDYLVNSRNATDNMPCYHMTEDERAIRALISAPPAKADRISVSMADVVTMFDHSVGVMGNGKGAECLAAWLRLIGVEVIDAPAPDAGGEGKA